MNAGLKCLFIALFYFQTGAIYVAIYLSELSNFLSQGLQMLNTIPGSLVDF